MERNPARVVVLSFAGAIAAGTLLLLIPAATAPGRHTDVLTALFTATSAVCVTGLTVVDTSKHWTPLGQAIILLLIQVGGLGIMTMSTLLFFLLGRRITLRERLLIQEALGQESLAGLVRLVRAILVATVTIEAAGALVLAARWSFDYPWRKALWYGVFHAVSAFNNAGFDIFGPSMMGYVGDPVVNLVIPGLIITGGIGFTVIMDLVYSRRLGRPLTLHTRLVLLTTAALIAAGFVVVLLAEWSNPRTLGGLPLGARLWAAFFQAVVPRTAGFFSVDIGALRPFTLLFMVVLMFIGASPNSTGGGIKTTTFSVVALTVWATIAGREDVTFAGRRLHWSVVNRAIAIAVIAFTLVVAVTGALLFIQGAPFLNLLFETTSAFGTVGLSAGVGTGSLTPTLNSWARLLIIGMMFIGRVGPLTAAVAIARRQRRRPLYRLPVDRVMVG
ncbi:MAG: TrkH family potassium uptake protein [Firmicutes bacterium]|nr:TrkH family potassium uptake protein [Bacillota bacterium]